jgi:Flp pilus assembly protein TadG
MRRDNDETPCGTAPGRTGRSQLRRFIRSKDGAAAIEFAILAIPYFLIVFAIIETFIAYMGEQLVGNAVDTLARELRTGNITYQRNNNDTDKDRTEFREIFCDEISILIKCSATEAAQPDKLLLDVRSFPSFKDIPTTIPRISNDPFAELDESSMAYSPGGPKTINMLRAYYKWDVITDLIRPYISNVRPAGGSRPSYFLIMETAAYQNEDYP